MRLRYLHLQNYPPIADIKVCFSSGSPLARECAIRFVVGVNGSGKSNLLRAVAEIFLALSDLRVPPFPVSLVYELGVRGSPNHRTLLLHCPGGRQQASLWVHERYTFPDDTDQQMFDLAVEHLRQREAPLVPGFAPLIAPGSWPLRDSTPPLLALPSAVLAYTTGDLRPWRSVWSRNQDAQGLLEASDDTPADERPAGWTSAQESALEAARQTERGTAQPDQDSARTDADSFRRPILVDTTLLKCALLAVALPQAFIETTDYPGRAELDAAMADLHHRNDNKNALQELLERGGWHHLVSVGFRCRLQTNTWDRKLRETAHDWWLCASEVITEPHPLEARRTVMFDLKGAFSAMDLPFRSAARDELDSCTTQGEALLALLGGVNDSTKFELFTRLLELNQAGLFDDVHLRLRRQPVPDADGDETVQDIGVLRYEELSDGEQMVLGRMALFHLLQGQQDALLLLDEPETHFNDKWKREIVDIIDEAIGNTANDVLISTHSAIVLTDVFNDEIVMVQKTDTGSVAVTVEGNTFATDPSELMVRIFGAKDSIGKRAQDHIEALVNTATGTEVDVAKINELVEQMGTGYYRSELRTILNRWKRERQKDA
ncbi:MAG: AAA family ATPase [Thiobacillus sp.]